MKGTELTLNSIKLAVQVNKYTTSVMKGTELTLNSIKLAVSGQQVHYECDEGY